MRDESYVNFCTKCVIMTQKDDPPCTSHFHIFHKFDSFLKLNCRVEEVVFRGDGKEGAGILHLIYRFRGGDNSW